MNVSGAPLMDFYQRLYPDQSFAIPPLLIGGVGLRDRIYPVRVDVVFGQMAINPVKCIEISQGELDFIFKHYPEQFRKAFYGVCDLWDFAYGVDDLTKYV